MALTWNDFIILPVCVIIALVIFKPDIHTIVGLIFKPILVLGGIVFLINLVARFRRFLISVRKSPTSTSDTGDRSLEYATAIDQSRQNAQERYNDQVVEYRENVMLPKEQEKQRIKEEKFYRMTGKPWSSPGLALGGSKTLSESSLRQQQTPTETSDDRVGPNSKKSASPASAVQKKKPFSLPEEPAVGAPDSITIALKTPIGRTHKRRFFTTDTVETLLNYMASVGYHPKVYALYSSYPRQIVSDNASVSLKELGIVQGVLLNIEEKE